MNIMNYKLTEASSHLSEIFYSIYLGFFFLFSLLFRVHVSVHSLLYLVCILTLLYCFLRVFIHVMIIFVFLCSCLFHAFLCLPNFPMPLFFFVLFSLSFQIILVCVRIVHALIVLLCLVLESILHCSIYVFVHIHAHAVLFIFLFRFF